MACGIYKITNKINNKVYIGQSLDIKRRWSEHKSRVNEINSNCYNKPLYHSIRKYGIENFLFEIIEECAPEELNDKEKYYIELFNCIVPNGYNILGSSDKIKEPTHRCKNCGKIISSKTINSLCRDCYCKTTRKIERPTKEILYQQLIDFKGNFVQVGKQYNVVDNTIRKWCASYGLPTHSKDYNKQEIPKIYSNITVIESKKRVAQINKDTDEIIAIFESASDAAKALNKKNSHITEVCNGIHKTAYGYKWKYI